MRVGAAARRAGAVVVLVTAALVGLSGRLAPARAVSATATVGWWSQAPAAALSAGPSPVVPPGGLDVANGAAGPEAISAVRFAADRGASARVTLTLGSNATPSTTSIAACPTTAAWAATSGGSLDQAPAYDCGLGVALGTLDASSTTMTWVLPSSFVRAGAIDVALVPASGASPFSAPFQPPSDGAIDVTSPSGGSTSTGEVGASPAEIATNGSGSGVATPADGAAPLAAAPSTSSATGPIGSTAAPPAARRSPARGRNLPAAPVALRRPDQRSQRLLAVALLAALAAACYRLSVTPARPRRSIVPLRSSPLIGEAPARSRGIGRYVRPREGPPLSL